jgi:hypothetical protein
MPALKSRNDREERPMRSGARGAAHILQRTGLAMAGAAGALFVATHVGSTFTALMSEGFLVVMMIAGAIGFYLGIDTPPHRFLGLDTEFVKGWTAGRIDLAEFLTAVGTFLAALTAFVSVALIVLGRDPRLGSTFLLTAGWMIGTLMQIIAGTIARIRR